MAEEWGKWVEHDGRGCPVIGHYVHVQYEDGEEAYGIAGSRPPLVGCSWTWSDLVHCIVRYRVRKPLGLTLLEGLIADLPVPALDTLPREGVPA